MAKEGPFKPREYPKLPLKETISALPRPYDGDVTSIIDSQLPSAKTPVLIILDDDSTGTQTCHDIAVLTVWDHDTLYSELTSATKGFFILTNSRAFPAAEARELVVTICQNVVAAAKQADKKFSIVLRGDSTLRGHFPEEAEAVEEVLGKADNWILAPFFFQGGRYTIGDVHYVREGDVLVPASQTPFAEDATFGYRSSSLRDWVLEKAGSRFTERDILSISIENIRNDGKHVIAQKLLRAPRGSVVIVNAAAESDMLLFAAAVVVAEQQDRSYLYRTGAAFVSSRLGITGIPPLSPEDLDTNYATNRTGGLIIAGSYVPKTTAQLATLREQRGTKLHVIELDVSKVIHAEAADAVVRWVISDMNDRIATGEDVLVMTSRSLITGGDAASSLRIGGLVATVLVKVIEGLAQRPRYIIAKGGITASDVATKGLKMKRAMVIGQAAPGVPLWKCNEPTSTHAGVPYIVFPGNVGDNYALADMVQRWALPEQ
ncbi:MAG: hypothetical protein M1818_007232 [Claussenomyces sp. TS43310]|nr:MAG: hypothetical protein M1818_007232 [Claussenomyces sp. TS43310]